MKKFLALLLVLALTLSMAVPAAAEEGNSGSAMQALKLLQDSKGSGMEACYVYPYADVNGAGVSPNGKLWLRFKQQQNTPDANDIFCVAIFEGSAEDINNGDPVALVEYREYYMSEFANQNRSFGMTWWADPDYYWEGEYVLLCYVISEDGAIYDQDIFASDLVVKEWRQTAHSVGLCLVQDGNVYEVNYLQPKTNTTLVMCPVVYPYGHSSAEKFHVESSNPQVASVKLEADGYITVTTHAVGETNIRVTYGNHGDQIYLKVTGLTNYEIRPGTTTMCVGMTDTVETLETPAGMPVYYKWYTSAPEIATVNNGVVTAHAPGYVVISVEGGGIHHGTGYTISYHELPEGTPVTERTATQPVMSEGHCSVCGQDNCVNIYESAIFTDTDYKAWYAPHVDYVYDEKIMNGTGEHTFGPNMALSRAMVVTVLYRAAGSPEVTGEMPFADVEAGQWYSDAILWAYRNEVVKGVGDGSRFDPNGNITREQIATILWRYTYNLGAEMGAGADLSTFPDGAMVSGFAEEGMAWAVGEGLITGAVSNGVTTLNPWNTATRAQFATIISRYQQMFQ